VAGAMKLNRDAVIKENEAVVIILTAHGSKFSNTSVEYHKNSANQFANQAQTIPANLEYLESALNL
jgi:threonine synthase